MSARSYSHRQRAMIACGLLAVSVLCAIGGFVAAPLFPNDTVMLIDTPNVQMSRDVSSLIYGVGLAFFFMFSNFAVALVAPRNTEASAVLFIVGSIAGICGAHGLIVLCNHLF